MRYFLFIFFSFLLSSFSCQKKGIKKNEPVKKPTMDVVIKNSKYARLDDTSSKEIKLWKEYFITADFLQKLEKTTPVEALNNAIELKKLTKQLKDSLNIKILKTPAFKARVNVFENEVLRLADMTYIPSITATEINKQVAKIFSLYGSMNTKINTVYAKQRFDKAIKLDSLFNFK